MKESEAINRRRREFLVSSSFMLLAAGWLRASPLSVQAVQEATSSTAELSPSELEIVRNSVMASDIDNFFGKGYSCSETGLAVALRFMKKPEELVWAAGGFGGGMGHQDLCGFLTAGIMAIGLAAGTLEIDRREAKNHCSLTVNAYWDWWVSNAPLRCAQIREGHEGFSVCSRLGKLALAKLEELLKMRSAPAQPA